MAIKLEKTFSIDDGGKRGPIAMARVRAHPLVPVLVAQCADRRLALWDLDAAPQKVRNRDSVPGILVCPHEAGWIRALDIASNGKWLATGGSDRRLKLWEWSKSRPNEQPTADVAGHDGWIESLAFSPNGAQIATVGADRQIKLWDAANLKLIRSAPAHEKFPRDVIWTNDGKQLVSGGEDGQVIIWNAPTLTAERTIDYGDSNDQQGQTPGISGANRLAISPDGRWLAVGGGRMTRIFEFASGHPAAAVPMAGMDVIFDAKRGLFASGEATVSIWKIDLSKLSPKPPVPSKEKGGKPSSGPLPGVPGMEIGTIKKGEFSLGLCFTPDGRVASGRSDGTVELWQMA